MAELFGKRDYCEEIFIVGSPSLGMLKLVSVLLSPYGIALLHNFISLSTLTLRYL